ncbi:MAG: agarase, partial [Acidobacteria bacterium]|nr:agarase [Acidobacteriota bacterium]
RGLSAGLRQTSNDGERGIAYRYYVEQAASMPALIGAHWFEWVDEPATGRFDGENFNIGLVDVTDRPYAGLVEGLVQTHKSLRAVHSGQQPPVTRKAAVQ